MWKVKLSDKAEEELINNYKFGKISQEDIGIIKIWVNQVESYGPEAIRDQGKWDDHALHGVWEGFRSSCFSNSGRIIYRIFDKRIIVEVVRVTPNHNYGSRI